MQPRRRTLVLHFFRHSPQSLATVMLASLGTAVWLGLAVHASAAEPQAAFDGSPATRLQEQLRSGEFGPALHEALQNPSVTQRSQSLRHIAAAQERAGEFAAAATTAGYLPRSPERSRFLSQATAERSHAGGTGADFDSLMDLIKSTIDPDSWEDNGGKGTMQSFETGVRVDPQGVLRQLPREETRGRLAALSQRVRQADLSANMARSSSLRMVSLTRLERQVAERLAAGQPILESMQRLAGLTRIQYLFVYPEDREIVVAGPAGAWDYDAEGRAVGREQQQPVLHLDDFVVVLRTFSPGSREIFGCSINPRAENLKALKAFIDGQTDQGGLSPGGVRRWVQELQNILGQQDVEIYGVPADSHVGRVLVEADYRMKLIGIAKLDGGPRVPSYFDLLNTDRAARHAPLAALRWWMTMKYSGLQHSPDRNAFEIQGPSVQVLSENQFITAQGDHVSTGVAEPLNRRFATNFTEHYADVARQYPVFGEMRNIFDQALVAALLQHEQIPQRLGWDLGVFAVKGSYVVQRVAAPKTVDTVAHHRVYKGKEVVVQVAGGVRGSLGVVVTDRNLHHSVPALAGIAAVGKRPVLPANRWWWDAAK